MMAKEIGIVNKIINTTVQLFVIFDFNFFFFLFVYKNRI